MTRAVLQVLPSEIRHGERCPCGQQLACGVCEEDVQCGRKHMHPTRAEQAELAEQWEALLWGPPENIFGRGLVPRGEYTPETCGLCELQPSYIPTKRGFPICLRCFNELAWGRQGQKKITP